jgi:hypothetical protein
MVIYYCQAQPFREASRNIEAAAHAMPTYSPMHPVILLVEDLESLRHTIQQILDEADFLVLPAANAVQALELEMVSSMLPRPFSRTTLLNRISALLAART